MNLLNVQWWNIPDTAHTDTTDHVYDDGQYGTSVYGAGGTEVHGCTETRWKAHTS